MVKDIKYYCEKKPLSKDFIENSLWLTEETFIKIKNWELKPTEWVAIKLANYFNLSLDTFYSWKTKNYNKDIEKYKQMIQNFLKYFKNKIEILKLAHLCYLLDFVWYFYHLEPISWFQYRKTDFWLIPDEFLNILTELEGQEIKNDKLSIDQLALLEKIAKKWKDRTPDELFDFIRKQLTWSIFSKNEIISYEVITQEEFKNLY